MGYSHHYDIIKGVDDSKEGGDVVVREVDIKDELRHTSTAVTVSWWKFVLCNLLAAGVGAGAMFLVAGDSFTFTSPPSGSAAVSTVPSATLSASRTLSTSSPIEQAKAGLMIQGNMPMVVLDCGHSPEEARAKGCVYDVMMQDWVPEPCYDKALTEQYLKEGNYTWYADGDGKTTISDEEMRKGEHGAAWMSTSYHKDHCVFSWLKIIRALRNSNGISQELLSYDHVLHCKHGALREEDDPTNLGVKAPTNYAKCALYETWKLDFIPDEHDSTQK